MSKWSKKYGKDHPECVMSGNEMIAKEMANNIVESGWVKELREALQNTYNKGFVDGVKSVGHK